MNKKGLTEPRNIIAFLIGFFIIAIALVPLLAKFHVIAFSFAWLEGEIGLRIIGMIIGIVGIYLIIDGWIEAHTISRITMGFGLFALLVGINGLFKLLSWGFLHNPYLFYVIMILEGIFLLVAGLMML